MPLPNAEQARPIDNSLPTQRGMMALKYKPKFRQYPLFGKNS
jgi:hypothetical protein